MTSSVSAISGALFPYLPASRVARYSVGPAGAAGDSESGDAAESAYARPLGLPPGSADLFARFVEDASATGAPAGAFDILARDFRRLVPPPPAGRVFDGYA